MAITLFFSPNGIVNTHHYVSHLSHVIQFVLIWRECYFARHNVAVTLFFNFNLRTCKMALDWIFTFSIGALQDSHGGNDGPQSSFQATVCDARENRQKQDVNVSSGKSLQRKPAKPHRCGWSALLQPVGTWLQTRWEALYVSFFRTSCPQIPGLRTVLCVCPCVDYKLLGILKRQFPKVPLLGLTATATSSVLRDCETILCVKQPVTLTASFNRTNLYYEVVTAVLTYTHLLCTHLLIHFWLSHFFELLSRKILFLSFHVQLITSQLKVTGTLTVCLSPRSVSKNLTWMPHQMILLSWSIADTRTSQVDSWEKKTLITLRQIFSRFWSHWVILDCMYGIPSNYSPRFLICFSQGSCTCSLKKKQRHYQVNSRRGRSRRPPTTLIWTRRTSLRSTTIGLLTKSRWTFLSFFLYLKAGKAEVKASGFLMLPEIII